MHRVCKWTVKSSFVWEYVLSNAYLNVKMFIESQIIREDRITNIGSDVEQLRLLRSGNVSELNTFHQVTTTGFHISFSTRSNGSPASSERLNRKWVVRSSKFSMELEEKTQLENVHLQLSTNFHQIPSHHWNDFRQVGLLTFSFHN